MAEQRRHLVVHAGLTGTSAYGSVYLNNPWLTTTTVTASASARSSSTRSSSRSTWA